MPEFSQEGADIKRRFLQIYDQWEKDFYDGPKPRQTASNPTGKGITKGRAHRGLYSLLLSPDDVHLDYIDNRLTKGATVKSMMGGLGGRVQKLTEGASSIYSPHPNDSLHHGNNHSSYGATARIQDQNLLRRWLQISADNGETYGEGSGNLKGNSQDVRSHLGNRGKGGKKFNPTHAGVGQDGVTELSSHPRGSTDAETAIEHKRYDSPEEMYEAGSEVRKIHKQDLELGTAADTPRRNFANAALAKEGIIKPGDDAWSADFPLQDIKRVKAELGKRQTLMTQIAEAWDPKLAAEVARQRKFHMNGLGGAAGLMMDPDAAKKFAQGDIMGGLQTGGLSFLKGEAVSQAVQRVAPHLGQLFTRAAPVVKAVSPVGQAVGGYQVANELVKAGTGEGFVKKVQNVQDKDRTRQINAQAQQTTQQLAVKRKQTGQDQSVADKVTNVIDKAANDLEYLVKNPLSIFGIK